MTKISVGTLLLFLIHLPGVFLFRGEFTDGVLQTVYFEEPVYVLGEGVSPAKYVPPLYPGLIAGVQSFGPGPLEAGRLVSLVAYCGTAIALAMFACWLGGRREGTLSPASLGWTAWGFWALSPVANQWAFHAMTDMTFCFLATLAIVFFLVACSRQWDNPVRYWFFGNVIAVLATWTRYQGYALVGAAALSMGVILLRALQRGSDEHRTGWSKLLNKKNVGLLTLVIVAWFQTYSFQQQGRSVHEGQFAERAVYDLHIYLNFALAGLQYFPYAITPPLFILFMAGIYDCLKTGGLRLFWILVGLAGGVLGLVAQTWFLSFQFRYGLPLLPWVCLLAALGLHSLPKRLLVPSISLTLLWLAVFTGVILYFQHGTFADLESAAKQIPEHLEEGNRVWAREEYNFLSDGQVRYGNIKVSVWSGIPVHWLEDHSLTELREGDLLVDPNVTPIPQEFWKEIRNRWKTEVLIEETWESLPLTPGEVLWVPLPTPQGTRLIRGTSDPHLMQFRYRKQYYSTVVHRLISLRK